MARECTQAGPDGAPAHSERDSIFVVASILIYDCSDARAGTSTNDASDQRACSPAPRLLQVGATPKGCGNQRDYREAYDCPRDMRIPTHLPLLRMRDLGTLADVRDGLQCDRK